MISPNKFTFKIPPLSLYIHIPWCTTKCRFCDFNSHVSNNIHLLENVYINSLIADLTNEHEHLYGRKLISIFIGGGTPSLLSAKSFEKLLDFIECKIGFSYTNKIEITIEVNPGTMNKQKLIDYKQIGINRLSIGVQSFIDTQLKILGCIHNATDSMKLLNLAHLVGFDNINIDLMYGLPGQGIAEALYDLNTSIILQPTHISWYQLTLEPNTLFWKKPCPSPNEEMIDKIQNIGNLTISNNGYKKYEISSYSKNGYRSTHNINYWTYGDYIGIGAGAHSKISSQEKTIIRKWKTRVPKDYINPHKQFTAGIKVLNKKDITFEFMMNVLRLVNGVPYKLYKYRTGQSLEILYKTCNNAVKSGLLIHDKVLLCPSKKGHLFLNNLLHLFL